MRKNRTKHEAGKHRAAKRALALCFALIFVCSCLLPAFANSGVEFEAEPADSVVLEEPLSDPEPLEEEQVEPEALDEEPEEEPEEPDPVVEEASSSSEEPAASSEAPAESKEPVEEPAASSSEPSEEPAASSSEEPEEPASSSASGEAASSTASSSEAASSSASSASSSTASGDVINQGEAAYTYRFWTKEIDAFDLEQIDRAVKDGTSLNAAAKSVAGIAPCKVLKVANNAHLADYTVEEPTKAGYEFAGWYTVENGTEYEFSFDQNVSFEESKTIDVFAKWEKLTTKKASTMVDVDAMAMDTVSLMDMSDDRVADSSASIYVTVEATNLSNKSELVLEPSSNTAIDRYCTANELVQFFTLSITPKDETTGEKLEPKETSTVTISGLSELNLPDEVTIVHKKDNGGIEEIKAEHNNGTVTFKTDSFSDFAVTAGYAWSSITSSVKVTLENAEVLWVQYTDSTTLQTIKDNLAKQTTSGTLTKSHSGQGNYWLFFIRPKNNYMVTGTDTSGDGHVYDIYGDRFYEDNTKQNYKDVYPHFTEILDYVKQLNNNLPANEAKYVGVFGYARKNGVQVSADVTIKGQQPDIAVKAICNQTSNVKPGDNLTFDVTITPGHTPSGKDTVDNVEVENITINGQNVTWDALKDNGDGTWTTKVYYTATAEDCEKGEITLKVDAKTTYSVILNVTAGQHIKTTSVIKKEGETTCSIAPKDDVLYVSTIELSHGIAAITDCPDEIQSTHDPVDNDTHYAGSLVDIKNTEATAGNGKTYPGKKVFDAVNGGEWTFDGWYISTRKAGNQETMPSQGKLILTGKWTFEKTVLNITITKKVDSGDKSKEFKFKVTSDDFGNTTDSTKADKVTLVDKNGQTQSPQTWFELKDGESATLKGLKLGYIFTIEEDKNNSIEYDTTATENIAVEAGNTKSFRYKVVEENGQLVLQPIAEKDDSQLTGKSNITDGKVVVTNSAAATSLTVSKKVLNGNATAPADAEFTFRLTVATNAKVYQKVKLAKNGEDITSQSVVSGHKNQWEFKLKDGESVHISGIRIDDENVKVEEIINDNHYTTKYKVNSEAETEGTTAAIPAATLAANQSNGTTVEFSNTYNIPKLDSVTIKKTVTGEFGERDKDFAFSVTLTDKDGKTVTGGSHTGATSLNSFTLKHGQSVTLNQIPVGTTITITETGADDYETKATNYKDYIKAGDRTFVYEVVEHNGEATLMTKATVFGVFERDKAVANNAITVTNNKGGRPDTGILLDTLPYLIILGIAIGGAALLIIRRGKHDDE